MELFRLTQENLVGSGIVCFEAGTGVVMPLGTNSVAASSDTVIALEGDTSKGVLRDYCIPLEK